MRRALTVDQALRVRRGRLRRYVRRWPHSVATAVLRAHAGRARRLHVGDRSEIDAPYWVAFPCAIVADCRPRDIRQARRFLEDVTWAQYCLFLAIRIADDLYDRASPTDNSIWVTHDLSAEAIRVLRQHFNGRAFWSHCHAAISRCVSAIMAVDHRQLTRGRMRPRDTYLYANVSAVLTVGIAAAGSRFLTRRETASLLRCADNLAIAWQLIDDLDDIEEDLRRRRFNVAANLLGAKGPRASSRRILSDAVYGPGLDRLLALVERHARRAGRAAARLPLPSVRSHVARFEEDLRALSHHIHTERVAVFGRALRARLEEGRPARPT